MPDFGCWNSRLATPRQRVYRNSDARWQARGIPVTVRQGGRERYSVRSAVVGSTRVARRAGTSAAASTVAISATDAHESVSGSATLTPYRTPLWTVGTMYKALPSIRPMT